MEIAFAADAVTASSHFSGSDLAQEFCREIEIRREHVLRYALHEIRELVVHVVEALFGRQRKQITDPFLGRADGLLVTQPEVTLELRYFLNQEFEIGLFDHSDLRLLDSLDIEAGHGVVMEREEIGHPPVFDHELVRLFVSFWGNGIQPEAAFEHKKQFEAWFSRFEQVLLFCRRDERNAREQQFGFVFVQRDEFFDV